MPAITGRIAVIADTIERYVTEHPRAADTVEGVRSWWIARDLPGLARADVQQALDHLVETGGLSRTLLPDGSALYAAPHPCAGEL